MLSNDAIAWFSVSTDIVGLCQRLHQNLRMSIDATSGISGQPTQRVGFSPFPRRAASQAISSGRFPSPWVVKTHQTTAH